MKQSIKKSYTKFDLAGKIQELFSSHSIYSLCMKMYSDDDDVDIVIIDSKQYYLAMKLLTTNGWRKKNNKSKLRERDKDMFVHKAYSDTIHLHQYFSWNTVPYLDSKILWGRKRKYLGVFLPSFEDELLIIAAHSLFENMCIVPEEIRYGKDLLQKHLNMAYIVNHADRFSWKKGLQTVVTKLKKNDPKLRISELLQARIEKFTHDLQEGKFFLFLNEIIAYPFIDWIWCYKNRNKKLYAIS